MATWVNFEKVADFSAVQNKYKRVAQFLKAVRAEAYGSAVWAKRRGPDATEPQGRSDWQVDIRAIPLVRPLNVGGAIR
jgi:hypothetical protein